MTLTAHTTNDAGLAARLARARIAAAEMAARMARESVTPPTAPSCLTCGCATRGVHAGPIIAQRVTGTRTCRTRVPVMIDDCSRGACWHWDHLHHYPRGGRSAAMRSQQYAPAMLRGQEVPQTTLAA